MSALSVRKKTNSAQPGFWLRSPRGGRRVFHGQLGVRGLFSERSGWAARHAASDVGALDAPHEFGLRDEIGYFELPMLPIGNRLEAKEETRLLSDEAGSCRVDERLPPLDVDIVDEA